MAQRSQGDDDMRLGRALLLKIAAPLTVSVVAAFIIAAAGYAWATMESVRQIQDTRYTREDGKNERDERVAGDNALREQMTKLTVEMTRLAERESAYERLLVRLEAIIAELNTEIRTLRTSFESLKDEFTKEFVRKNELPGYLGDQ